MPGARLLSHFPAATHDRARYRQVFGVHAKAAPLQSFVLSIPADTMLRARLARGSLRTPWRRRKAYRNLA
jgi:hypothetical protein